jgi:hypothetical protein
MGNEGEKSLWWRRRGRCGLSRAADGAGGVPRRARGAAVRRCCARMRAARRRPRVSCNTLAGRTPVEPNCLGLPPESDENPRQFARLPRMCCETRAPCTTTRAALRSRHAGHPRARARAGGLTPHCQSRPPARAERAKPLARTPGRRWRGRRAVAGASGARKAAGADAGPSLARTPGPSLGRTPRPSRRRGCPQAAGADAPPKPPGGARAGGARRPTTAGHSSNPARPGRPAGAAGAAGSPVGREARGAGRRRRRPSRGAGCGSWSAAGGSDRRRACR